MIRYQETKRSFLVPDHGACPWNNCHEEMYSTPIQKTRQMGAKAKAIRKAHEDTQENSGSELSVDP